jgi:hypothetical protein
MTVAVATTTAVLMSEIQIGTGGSGDDDRSE